MKNKYLKSMTAHVIMVMLSVLCLTGAQAIGAQNRNMGGGSPSGGSSAANASSSQKPIMPLMTRSTSNAVSVNETEYATWADAVTAINESSEENFDIVLINHVMDAKTMPSKPCTISGKTTDINFTYIDDNSYLTRIQMSAPVTFKNITLQLGETYLLDVTLTESLSLDEVVVTASKAALFNSQKTGAAQNFNQEQILSTPTINRSIFDITKMNPLGVNTGAGMSFAGSSNKYNSFQIDGAVSNDVFGLSDSGTNGGKTGMNPISLDAIEEIQVVIAPFDVRQGGFTGGGVNAITKSGTNTFHGSAYGYYNNEKFYGKTAGKDVKERKKLTDLSTETYGFTFGGPIIKNKLFFFTNFERTKEFHPSSNNIGSESSSLKQEEVDQVIGKIKELSGGYDGGGYGPQDVDTYSNKFLARIDWNINRNNKFTARYSLLDASKMNFSNSKSYAKLNDCGYYNTNSTHSLTMELNTTINPMLANELRAGWTRVRDNQDAIGTPFPYVKIANMTGGSLEFGTEANSSANSLDQDIYTITDNLTWTKGAHAITFGTHNEFFHMANLFISSNYGSLR